VKSRARLVAMVAAVMMPILLMSSPAVAADAEDIDRDANAAFPLLYQTTPAALRLPPLAKAILIFPSIVKAGFIGGAQYGNGAPGKGGKTTGYYNMTAVSYGQQSGVQSFR
jgi:lipid-binding SYLF domain-containing protein